MLNKIFIMGRLTRDPELRRTQSGTPVTSFSLAVDRDFKIPVRREGDGFHRRGRLAQHRGVRRQVLYQGPHGRGGGPAPDPRLDRTGTATSAAARRLWPTTSTSATASATARSAAATTPGQRRTRQLRRRSAYGAPSGGYAAPVGGFLGDFAEIDEEDGDLPF